MTGKTFLSQAEMNLLLALTLIASFLFFLNLENKATESYNQSAKFEQEEKLQRANNPDYKPVSFGLTDCFSTPFWHLLYALQFFTGPISFFLIRDKKIGSFILSSIFTSITFYCFSMWIYGTFYWVGYQENEILEELSFNHYFLLESTKLESALFPFIAILFILQAFILLRFAADRFQAKISPD